MSRTEFLKALRQKLSESMTSGEVEEQVRYYDNYIREAVKGGQSEEEVMASLGDPVLIARTILEAPGGGYSSGGSGGGYASGSASSGRDSGSSGGYSSGAGGSYDYRERPSAQKGGDGIKIKRISSLGCIAAAVIFFLVLFLLLRLVGAVMALAFRIAAPILLVILLAVLIRNLNRR
ncbi:MAG TPA: DUF1700 domain-containing protein [Candidatus Egerieimonas intestinavium]|uniref:DUF1700 domain-containing protein n=1 Tax=Candidatus Egerieimonas intestinavium TaxID=2840777 RepID=A0A9D1EIG0_9FIRM|nr:DUF1700 domain-containing protein [Candidatus Egerieimonas intestinavium]